ncbi:amidohydrolase family protein [Streptomyces sp. NPDC002870]|uniref:amidohydrolase family protein n=1 Tax=Streptomyces sp. NPDC002870 TaxID=3364666 RepID=UPI0036A308BB
MATDPLDDQRHSDGSLITDDVDRRLAEMDADGVWAEAIFGNLGLYLLRLADPQYAMACCRAYNDYVAELFTDHRDRAIAVAMISVADPEAAVQEIERVAGLGLRGIALPMLPPTPYFGREYDKVWAAAQANRLPVNFHFDDAGLDLSTATWPQLLGARFDRASLAHPRAAKVATTALPSLLTLIPQHLVATLVGSGILAAHPELRVVCVETNAGWLASLMESMDFAWTVDGKIDWPYPLEPSDYVRRQVKVTFQDEPASLQFLSVTGHETLMWGSDFPHPEGTWPHSRKITDELFQDVEPTARRAILGENLLQLYGIPAPANECDDDLRGRVKQADCP